MFDPIFMKLCQNVYLYKMEARIKNVRMCIDIKSRLWMKQEHAWLKTRSVGHYFLLLEQTGELCCLMTAFVSISYLFLSRDSLNRTFYLNNLQCTSVLYLGSFW